VEPTGGHIHPIKNLLGFVPHRPLSMGGAFVDEEFCLVNGTSGFEQPARMKANAERAAKDLRKLDRNLFCISLVFGIGVVD
jgi:hypothetical protein